MKMYVVDPRRHALDNAWPTPEEAIEKAGEAARRHPEENPNGASVWEIDPDRPAERYPLGRVSRQHYCRVQRDGTVIKTKPGHNPYGDLMEGRDEDGTAGPDGSGGHDDTVEHVLAGLDARAVARLADNVASIAAELRHRGAGERVVARVHGLADRMAVLREDGMLGVTADGEAEADHVPAGSVGVVDDRDHVFVLFLDQVDGGPQYCVLDENNVMRHVPDSPERIRMAGDTGDPAATQLGRVWAAFMKSLLRLVGAKDAASLDPEQRRLIKREAQAKWPTVRSRMLPSADKPSAEPASDSAPAPKPGEAPERPGQRAVKPVETKPKPKAVEPAVESMAGFLLNVCGGDINATARLVRSFAFARERDPTKFRALTGMKRYSGHDLPAGWVEHAAALQDREVAAIARAGKTDLLVPPTDVRQVAGRALAAARLTDVTADYARRLAAGRALGPQDVGLVRAVLARGPERLADAWDAWGGHAAVRWMDRLAAEAGF